MRLRSLLVLGTAALLLLTACAPEPEPSPTRTPTASATPTPTPTPDPIVAPEAAFDVTCEDVAAEMTALLGEPSTPMLPVLSIVSSPSWRPGPAQHMFQRAGGIACSAGDVSRYWEVSLVPNAQTVIAGATERGGYWGEVSWCSEGICRLEFPDGDVLLSVEISEPGIGEGDLARVDTALRGLLASAAASVHEVEQEPSDLAGAPCERYITAEQLNGIVGASDAILFTDFGGWGIPAEVYEVVNGSRICYYTSSPSGYEGSSYLMVTSLPAGAWAFEEELGDPVEVEGADAAKTRTGEHGERILDVRLGLDWIRFMTYDNGAGASDPVPLAAAAVRNLTMGATAPE